MRTSVNFNHLECFFSLAKTLSFSKTSEELQIAQPAVSKQIKSIEEHFEKQLFIRSRQKVELTTDGKELYESTWPLYQELCSRLDSFKSGEDAVEGKLIIGCPPEFGRKLLIKALNEFLKKYPLIKFEVNFLKSQETIDGLKNGTIHLGITTHSLLQENIRCYEFLKEESILVTSKKNEKKSFDRITDLPFVASRSNDPLLLAYLKKNSPKAKLNRINIEFTVNSHKSIIDVVKKHNFYAVLPRMSVQDELKKGELVKIEGKDLKSKLYIMHADLEFLDQKVILLRDFLRNYLNQ